LTNASWQIQPIEPGAGDPGRGIGSAKCPRSKAPLRAPATSAQAALCLGSAPQQERTPRAGDCDPIGQAKLAQVKETAMSQLAPRRSLKRLSFHNLVVPLSVETSPFQ